MTDNINKVVIDGRTGHEIIGNIAVIRVDHEIGDPREFHLELEIDDHLAEQLVKYGSEVFNEVDLLSSGIRAGLIERYARKQAGSGAA
jgi:hypothetical protein